MSQLWTIIFVALIAAAYGIAAWHDRDDEKQQQRRDAAYEKRTDTET